LNYKVQLNAPFRDESKTSRNRGLQFSIQKTREILTTLMSTAVGIVSSDSCDKDEEKYDCKINLKNKNGEV
jgi:hypothetical protein